MEFVFIIISHARRSNDVNDPGLGGELCVFKCGGGAGKIYYALNTV